MKPGTVLRLQFAESTPGYIYAPPEAAALQALQDTLPTLDLPRADSDAGEHLFDDSVSTLFMSGKLCIVQLVIFCLA